MKIKGYELQSITVGAEGFAAELGVCGREFSIIFPATKYPATDRCAPLLTAKAHT
jgi:hypothetical protein